MNHSVLNHFTRIPNAAYEALELGEITRLMFDMLLLLHKWADWNTGQVRSVSAERIVQNLHYEKGPSLETVRRHLRGLRQAGWIRSDYIAGWKRPYNAMLNNYVAQRGGRYRDSSEVSAGCDRECELNCEELVLNPSEIKDWRETATYRGSDSDSDGAVEIAANNQNTDSNAADAATKLESDGQGRESLKGKGRVAKARKASNIAVEELRAFTFELTSVVPARGGIDRVLADYELQEIKEALEEYINADSGNATKKGIKMFFDHDGASVVIHVRRDRAKKEEFKRIAEPIAAFAISLDRRISVSDNSKIELGKITIDLKPSEAEIAAIVRKRLERYKGQKYIGFDLVRNLADDIRRYRRQKAEADIPVKPTDCSACVATAGTASQGQCTLTAGEAQVAELRTQ